MMNPAHLDYDTLADLAEGLLEDDQAASVNAHLDTCAECRERSADLADVSRILAEAPVPPLPAELAERIDTAIAAESLNNATVVSLEQRRGRRHWRILSAAAATVVVLGGGATVGKMALDGSTSGDHQTSANSPVTDPERRSPEGKQSSGERKSTLSAPNDQQPAYSVAHSGTDYRAGTLGDQVTGLLGKGQELRTMGAPADRRTTECVGKVTGGRSPALVDAAKFEGSPATVIALAGGRPGSWNIWVVGPNCSAQDANVLKYEQTG